MKSLIVKYYNSNEKINKWYYKFSYHGNAESDEYDCLEHFDGLTSNVLFFKGSPDFYMHWTWL